MIQSTIRTASISDAEAIALVHIRSWQKAYEHYIPESILNSLSVLERAQQWYGLIHKGITVLVLETDNQIVGFVGICDFRDNSKDNFCGEISAIYLHPDYWRQGFGTKLCLAALYELAQKNYKKVYLWILADNNPARMFYKNLGFEATGDTKLEEFYDGGALLSEVLYMKTI